MPEAWEAPVQEMPDADGTLLGAVSIEVDRASPLPRDDTGGLLHDLVTHGSGPGMPGIAVPGDTILALGFLGVVGSGVAGLCLSGSPDFPPPPINWRRVEGDAEFVVS
jgi:hypothetical protein